MYSLNLPQEIEDRLVSLANETGRDKDDLMNEALLRGIQDILEDMEDVADATKIMQSSSRQWTLEEVEARIDLESHL
ncbi:hypothetical protein [Crocosphaera sp.]|uniref:type II toxin-antitoxin system RelB family antitoxin n=1 Tax=Crocosphaera sp. TaxID=2729996 RepID=UPI002639BF97|nr:hypothetical protein [Crocosphaera sp.]MDJ0581816.1 hypothetical protein [Crocosphaera sp.]